ncbi:hypothetical protein ACFLV3_00690 [Chloroflexota bacterium]
MAEDTEGHEELTRKNELVAARRAQDKARTARWDLDIAVFLFAVLIIVIILLFQGIGIEVVAPVAIFGLSMVWFVGWRRGKQIYQRLYEEELLKLKSASEKTMEETIEEKVQRALRERGG